MNIGVLVEWARVAMVVLDDPSRLKPLGVEADRVRAKLGLLTGFCEEIADWSACQAVIDATLDFVRREGLYIGAGLDLAARLPAVSGGAGELREALIDFVTRQSSQARIGERLPGTTEVLESCFGRLKAIEDGQSKSGFTGLVLSLGVMVGKLDSATLGTMLERVGVREVIEWCRTKLGISVQSRRRQVYGIAARATELGRSHPGHKPKVSSPQGGALPDDLAEVVLGADLLLQVGLLLRELVPERRDLLEGQGVFDGQGDLVGDELEEADVSRIVGGRLLGREH